MDRPTPTALTGTENTLNFGPFSVDVRLRVLFLRGERVDAGPKVVETLLVLLRAGGRYVPSQTILDAVWPDGSASLENLWRSISTLRKILNPVCGPAAITTLARRGYRLTAEPPAAAASEIAPPPRAARRFARLAASATAVALASAVIGIAGWSARPVPPTRDADAQLYAVAKYQLERRTPAALQHAVEDYRALVAAHPHGGAALAGLAESLLLRGDYLNIGHAANPDLAAAETFANAAVAACPACAEAHAALGFVQSYQSGKLESGLRELAVAAKLDPDSASTHLWYGQALIAHGDERQALVELQRAQNLDPTAVAADVWLARAYFFAGRPDRTAYFSRLALELNPGAFDAAILLGFTYEQSGDFARAIRVYRALRHTRADPALLDILIARAYAASGNYRRARALVRRLPASANDSVDVAVEAAGLLAALGDRRRALGVLARTVQTQGYVEHFKTDPRLASLWSDPALDAVENAQRPS